MRSGKMFAHRTSQGARSDSVNDSNFVTTLGGSKIESHVEPIERFIDAEAAQIRFYGAPDPR